MSGTFPSTILPASMTWRSVQPTLVSVTHSLKRQTRTRGGQRWGVALSYEARTRAELAPLVAFALSQQGQFDSFDFVPPLIGNPQGAGSGTPLVVGAHASGRSIATDGWTPSTTVLKAMDFIGFANHDKVYAVMSDVVSDGTGAAIVTIEPSLHAALVDNQALVIASVPFRMAFASDRHDIAMAPGGRYSWSCELVEAL